MRTSVALGFCTRVQVSTYSLEASPSGSQKVVWGESIPTESWHFWPAGESQYMARSAMMGLLPCTLVEKSVAPMPSTSFTFMVFLELALLAMNGLMRWSDQKYTTENKIRSDYAHIQEEFQAGEFPEEVIDDLQGMLGRIGRPPRVHTQIRGAGWQPAAGWEAASRSALRAGVAQWWDDVGCRGGHP